MSIAFYSKKPILIIMNLENFIQLAGPLFEAVAEDAIYSDGKTFVDSILNSKSE
ncbi:MAG: hypothetical protein P0S93_06665 [Candidatus Neptunochlamydia sp.]|nr:hypothetical protein [Candidatus Neptunochlamydia sp.]